ncbi:MAG TPA: flagellar type III secretion system pore protein FliP [Nocardioidaceae bacterium]|nr:flagellar type III secretion system pore protein FliP [Nocardioidaceae bacterium]
MAESRRAGRRPAAALAALVAGVLVALGALLLTAGTAAAAPVQATPVQAGLVQAGPVRDAPVFTAPDGPRGPNGPRDGGVTVRFDDITKKPSTPIIVLLGLTLLSLVPAILLTCTSFTKILVVLGLTRNALGLQQTPPNQVLAGLALFLSLFIMAPVLSQMNDDGLQPYLDGTKTQSQAWHDGVEPLRGFMLDQTGDKEIALLTEVAQRPEPQTPGDVPLSTLVPAFVLSELKQAFIIGFMIFIPFLVIDIVISGALMSLGMMMMPPVMVSLPFKLLLFVLVDGWALIVRSLVQSYTG